MQRVLKVAAAPSSALWFRRAGGGDLPRLSAMAMATKVKVDGGKNSSGIGDDAPGVNPAERQAFKDDMDKSYGSAYSQRSADEGFGERYGEPVKKSGEKHNTTELQSGETAERDQKEDSAVHVEYDMTQGEHVAEKEVSRHMSFYVRSTTRSDILVRAKTLGIEVEGKERVRASKVLSIDTAIEQLLEVEELRAEKVKDTLCVGLARLGTSTEKIVAGLMKKVLHVDFGLPLHS